MTTRRQLLKVGAASIALTGLGLGYYAGSRTPHTALAPWNDDAHNYDDIRLKALSYALLAPNPHNRQPWLADLSHAGEVGLICDLNRRLPATDPFDRQITIGLGCFVRLFEIAANEFGHSVTVQAFPEGEAVPRLDQRLVARLVMRPGGPLLRSTLFDAVKERRSNKEAYDVARPVTPSILTAIYGGVARKGVSVGGTVDGDMISALRALTWRAHKVENHTPRTLKESIDLMRIGKTEVNANPDGIDLGGPLIEVLSAVGMLDREQMLNPQSTAFQQGLEMYRKLMFSAMGYVWVVTEDNSRTSQLAAGHAWMDINLKVTQLGLAVHPLSQALQEYTEMDALYAELHERLAVSWPRRIQMLGRIGYGPKTQPSPRWGVNKCLAEQGKRKVI